MSGGAIFQEALRFVVRQGLPAVSENDVVAALKAGRPGPLEFVYEAGSDAELDCREILSRGVAIYFNFCAANLADDLSDGECSYLEEPYRLGPCTQFILQNMFFCAAAAEPLPNIALRDVARELIQGAGPQHLELRTTRWNSDLFKQVAEGIAGRQWSAYLQILWFGTRLEERAIPIGMNAGILAHTAKDIQTADPRFITMLPEHKEEILAWARASAQMLRAERLHCLDLLLLAVEPVLEGAL